MGRYLFVVETQPVAGQEDAYNDWYTNRHLADVVALPGFVSAQRFALVPHPNTRPADPAFRYLALYDIETDDLAEPFDALAAAVRTDRMPISDALDGPRSTRVYQAISPKLTED